MTSKTFGVCMSSLVAVTAACSVSGPARDLSYAAAMFTCGPADGPAVNLLLAHEPIASAEPAFPYVQVVFLGSVSSLAGRTWDITSALGPGAWYVTGPGKRESATSGSVTVTSVDSAKRVDGVVRLEFPSQSVATGFSAPWIESGVTCP